MYVRNVHVCTCVCASVLIPHMPHMYYTTRIIQKTTSACPGLCCLALQQGLFAVFPGGHRASQPAGFQGLLLALGVPALQTLKPPRILTQVL